MRFKILLSLGTAFAALSIGAFAGPASAGTGFPCGASALFAAQSDPSGYIKMNAVGGWNSLTYKASCVHFLEPVIRVVAHDNADPQATLTVSVQYRDATGSHNQTIGTMSGSDRISPAFSFDPNGLSGNVQVTLTPSGPASDWSIGGAYIDPFLAR